MDIFDNPIHLWILAFIVMMVFGAGKLPTAARDVARGIKGFRQELKDEPPPANAPADSRCSQCGQPVASDATFCSACGTRVVVRTERACPSCAARMPGDARFCPACGVPAVRHAAVTP